MARFPLASAARSAWAALLVLGGLACAPASAAVSLEECDEPIEVEGDRLGTNLRSNTTELRDVVITGCDTRIEAARAHVSSFDFEDSTWTFEGKVRIFMDTQLGRLQSDQAVVRFRNNQVQRVTITGSPAEFERQGGGVNANVLGHAREMVYDLDAGTVRLSGDAWLSSPGSGQIRHPQLIYDIRRQEVQTASRPGSGDRVRVTITPKAGEKPRGAQDPAAPESPEGAEGESPQSPAPQPDAPR